MGIPESNTQLPVQSAYDDVMDLWRDTGVGYTPTLCVAYGGILG